MTREETIDIEQQPSDDCVSRANLISKLEILERRYGSDFYWETRKIVDKLPSVKPQEPKWILVSERLPEKDKSVLLTICANSALYGFNENFVKVMCGSYSPCEDERDWIVNEIRYYIDNVIAWMPLPEPYKGE